METVERFSNRVENYIKYRPDYPREIISFLAEKCSLTRESIIADIGCGTGISSRMFLENGNRVFGVEPNALMRSAAEKYLSDFPWFIPINGNSEATTLADDSVDMIIAAQAFHWFDRVKTKPEFNRVLRPAGHIVLMWNERQIDSTPFLVDYEAFLLEYATDYQKVRHENIDADKLSQFFGKHVPSATFENVQVFDFEGLKGRMLSASYMPDSSDEVYPKMIEHLESVFAKHAENGRIKVFYDTNVFYSHA